MAAIERMTMADKTRTIAAAHVTGPALLCLSWSDGTSAECNLSGLLTHRAFAALGDPQEFAKVEVGDWGHSLAWPSGVELGADALWLETLSATGNGDARVPGMAHT